MLSRRALLLLACEVGCLLVGSACRGGEQRLGADLRDIEIKASVFPSRSVSLVAPADGTVVRLTARDGLDVAAGDVLLSLSNPDIESSVARASAQATIAEARMRNWRGGAPSGFAAPALDSDRRDATAVILQNKRIKLERYRKLAATQDVSRQELEEAENEYAAALRDSRQGQVALPTGNPGRDASESRILEASLEQARAEEASARARKEALQVKAPISGTVTRIHVVQGQSLFSRQPLLDLVDASTVEIRGMIAPELLRLVRPGSEAEVKILSVPPRTVKSRITYVVPVGGTSPAEPGATAVVVLPNPDGALHPNDAARILLRF